jgi:hypothetical protein
MEEVLKFTIKIVYMKDILIKESVMDMEGLLQLVGKFIKEDLSKIKWKDSDSSIGLMVDYMKEILSVGKKMA